MKEASEMVRSLLEDCAIRCSTVGSSRDMRTIKRRISNEGLSFLTITLSSFGDSFFRAIEEKRITSDLFIGWKKRRCLPAFLQGFTKLVFEEDSGVLRDAPNYEAIRSIRQICYFFKKIKLPCTDIREREAQEDYVQIDRDLSTVPSNVPLEDREAFKRICRLTMSSVFRESIDFDSLLPHHGPGSTMEGIRANQKYDALSYTWYEEYMPYTTPYSSEEVYNYTPQVHTTSVRNSFVKVITVPKTQKKPRVIAMEPVSTMYLQQALKDYLVPRIEGNSFFSGHVNFTDQSINQKLALRESRRGRLATLDLKAASDRVHFDFVDDLFAASPEFLHLVKICRTPHALVLGKMLTLNKFASMGSALCFPVEALFFFNVLLLARLKYRGKEHSFTFKDLCSLKRDIYVYGDDILIPVNEVECATRTLSEFGNVVGLDKSFYKGRFRESCGVDAYDGVDITPIYLRHLLPRTRREATAIVSLVATTNLLFNKGYWNVADYLARYVEGLTGNLPVLSDDSQGLGWCDEILCNGKIQKRFNTRYQRLEVKTLVPAVPYEEDEIVGYAALWKCLLDLERLSNVELRVRDKLHLQRSPRRGALTLKRRWVTA